MEISFNSFFSSALSITILTCILFLILQNHKVMTRFGLGCIAFLTFLLMFRGFLPIDFYSIGLTQAINSYHFLPWLRTLMLRELFTIASFSVTPFGILIAVWIIGAVVYLFRLAKGYYSVRKYLACLSQTTDDRIQQVFQAALDDAYPKRKPFFKIVRSDSFCTPAIFGLVKPVIVLPDFHYTEAELYYSFRHELLHHKHKDFLWNLLVNLLAAVHWWNPLISKLLLSVINQLQELLVDYDLIKVLDETTKDVYLKTLVNTLRYQQTVSSQNSMAHFLVGGQEKTTTLQRMRYIMEHPAKQFSVAGSLLCLLLFIASFTFVFEPYYEHETDETGNPVYQDVEGQTYYIRNGTNYDLYMENTYIGTVPDLLESFKDAPVYNSKEEVPHK